MPQTFQMRKRAEEEESRGGREGKGAKRRAMRRQDLSEYDGMKERSGDGFEPVFTED